jgi:lipopolysaccharide export system permease protein
MPKAEVNADVTDREALSTRALIDSNKPRLKIELQWRLSLPILVFVITLLAVPLSRVNPRQGRFLKLLPAILLYMAYLALLIAVRGALLKGQLPPGIGFWTVHVTFLLVGLLMLYWEPLQLRWKARRSVQEVAHG